MSWKENIPRSFGIDDMEFGTHALEQERAAILLISAIEAKVTEEEYVDAIKAYLVEKKCTEDHIEKQLKKVINIGFYLY